MRGKIITVLATVLLTITAGVIAQTSGFPSRPKFQTLTVAGQDLTPLVGTFVATFTNACTTDPAVTVNYTKVGNLVALRFLSGVSCTGDSISFQTAPGEVPASLRPVDQAAIGYGFQVQDNGAVQLQAGCVHITVGGAVLASRSIAQPCDGVANWTASGTKSFAASGLRQVLYMLN